MRSVLLVLGLLLGSLNVWGADVTDELTQTLTGVSGTSYTSWSNKTSNSDAVYAGQSAGGNSSIQLRSNNSNSGVITTKSGGKVKSVTVEWNTNTSNGRTINIYGKNTAYTQTTELYNTTNQGTLLGTIVMGTSTSLPVTGDYEYIGIRSASGALYLTSISIVWESGSSQPTVSAEPNDESYGSVSVSGTTITADPNEGYRVMSGADGYSVIAGDPTSVTNNGDNTFTVSTTEDCTIKINFEAIPQYTVTWNNHGLTSTSQVYEGEKPEFPETPSSCDATSTTFAGWATAAWDGKLADLAGKTVYTSASAMPAVTGEGTVYYAVFAKVAGESGWIETAIEDLGASDVFVIVGNNNSTYAMTNDNGTGSAPAATAVTILDGKISGSPADNIKWNISGNSTDGYTFYPNGDSENWLYCTNTNNGVRVGTNDNKTFIVNDEYLYHSATSRYVGIYNSQDWRCYTLTNNNEFPNNIANQTFSFYKYSAGSALDYMTTCCTKYNVTIADGIANGSVSADPTSACEGETVTLTFTPDLNYHLKSWSLNGVNQDVDENTFVMPAGNVEVNAVFAQDDCTPLGTPTNVTKSGLSYPYPVQLTWDEVTNANKYTVYIYTNEDEEVEHGDVTDEEYTVTALLAASTTYKYTIQAISNTPATYCPSALAQGTFSTEALPTATLKLMENGNEVSGGSHEITVPFALPDAVTHTCAKTFVGWTSKSDFANGDESLPSYYEKGAEFTFENTNDVTLYAVYADVTGGETSTTNIAYSGSTTNMDGTNQAATLVDATDVTGWSVVGEKGGNSNYPGLNTAGDIRLYYQSDNVGNTLTVTAPQTITSIALTFTGETYSNAWVKVAGETVTLTDGVYPINNTTFVIGNANTSNAQVRISNIAVNFATAGTASNYSTTCAAAPVAIVNPAEVNAPAAGVANGIIEIEYDNVNKENVTVASNSAWLTVSLNDDKNIVYTIAENTSYKDAREASISLTAPETNGATDPAVVVIPVNQAKKEAVFASLAELAAADVAANTNVTVTLTDVLIKEIYVYNNNRRGLVFNIQKDNEDVKIYFNADVPANWEAGGKVSGTLTDCPWKIYSGAWQLAPATGWNWNNLTYTEPAAVESIEIRGTATEKTYIDGQVFAHTGLKAIAIYGDSHEEDVTSLASWTYNPATLSEGDEEVTVIATYAEKSDDETVTGLTVNPIPNKTIAEFISAGGTRCYLEGTVSNITNTTYGNFDLTDASGSIYVYGCLTSASVSGQFGSLEVSAGDKIKVIAEEYLLYQKVGNPDKDEAVNVVFVSKISPVQITIANKTLEVGQSWNIEATTDPEGAVNNISYDIKDDGSNAFVSLNGKEITANAVGTATIIASIPAGEGYLANEIEFEVEVVEAGTIADVVILAKYDGQWYALMNEVGSASSTLNALAVDYNEAEGVLLDVAEPSAITWTRSIAAGNATFLNGTKYIAGGTSNTNLTLSESASEWTIDEAGHYMKGDRTFLYNNAGYFKNYNASTNAGKAQYSDYPVVLANPQFLTRADIRGSLSEGKWGTICPKQEVKYPAGASFYQLTYMELNSDGSPYKFFFDEIAENASLEAGKPYLFIAEGEQIKGVKVGDTKDEGDYAYNGFVGYIGEGKHISSTNNVYTDYTEGATNYYGLQNNVFKLIYSTSSTNNILDERAYVEISPTRKPSTTALPMPAYSKRRLVVGAGAPAVTTGMDELNASEAPVKVMIDGQLFIFRGEKMYNANGQLVK